MQQNQALRRSHDEVCRRRWRRRRSEVAAAKRELEDDEERRRERAQARRMDGCARAWAMGADLSPRASGAPPPSPADELSPSTPTARSRPDQPRRVAAPREAPVGGDASLEEAMLLEQENEQLASEAAQLASQCARRCRSRAPSSGDELHSQQLLATLRRAGAARAVAAGRA